MSEKQPLLAYNDRHDNDIVYECSRRTAARSNGNGKSERRAPCTHQATQITGATWMSHLPSTTLMSAITIPGTHDSAAYTYSWPFIATQTLNITAQLNAGIRYFDLRCGLRANILEMVHGQAILNLRLEQVLADMYTWLAAHPSEAPCTSPKPSPRLSPPPPTTGAQQTPRPSWANFAAASSSSAASRAPPRTL
jgi:hypothetical protein